MGNSSTGTRRVEVKQGHMFDMEELTDFAQLVDYLISNYYRKGSALATKQRERSGRFFSAVQADSRAVITLDRF